MSSAVRPVRTERTPGTPPFSRRTARVATRDGFEVHVEEYGDADAPVTLVLSHGYTLDHRSWHRLISDLSAELRFPVRILAYDQRGHGRSAPVPEGAATVARLGDDLAALLAACVPCGPVVLAGHSMGGMAIMAMAERHPRMFAERVAGIAFVSTSSGGLARLTYGLPRPVVRISRRLGRAAAHLRTRLAARRAKRPPGRPSPRVPRRAWRVPAALLRLGVRWLLFGRGPARDQVALIAAAVATAPPDTVRGFRASLEEHDRLAALSACRAIPTVVLCGERDRLLPPEHSRAIADALPACTFALCPDAGHMLPLERPGEVARHLAALLRKAGEARATGEARPRSGAAAGDVEGVR